MQRDLVAARRCTAPLHQFLADTLALAGPVDGQIGQVAAIGEVGNRPRNADKLARFIPGRDDDIGVLDHSLRELVVSCLPANIPDVVEVDVSGMGMNSSIKVEDITLPPNVTLVTELDRSVASVVAPVSEEELEAAVAATLVEGEELEEGVEVAEGEEVEGEEGEEGEKQAAEDSDQKEEGAE